MRFRMTPSGDLCSRVILQEVELTYVRKMASYRSICKPCIFDFTYFKMAITICYVETF